MITYRDKGHKGKNEKTVILLADFWQGALNAGRFAVKHLFDEQTLILLLQTYQKPAFGILMLRDFKSMLKKIASEELTHLKNQLMGEFGLPGKSIKKLILEGELESIIKNDLKKIWKPSLIIGLETQQNYLSSSCRNIINGIMNSDIRPVFLINDSITIIEDSRIIVIAEKEEKVTPEQLTSLKEISTNGIIPIEITTGDNKKSIMITPKTASHLSNRPGVKIPKLNSTEKVFYNQIIRVNMVAGKG